MKKQKIVVKATNYKSGLIKSDINIDTIINSLLYQTTFIRESNLIRMVQERCKCSHVTVARKLSKLKEHREIIIIENNELAKYGIIEHNKRAKYIASKEILALRDHIYAVFSLFDNKNVDDTKTAVGELRNIQTSPLSQYFLNQEQIDKLVDVLDQTLSEKSFRDGALRYGILTLIEHELTIHRLKPSNKDGIFVKTLGELLKQYPTTSYNGRSDSPLPHITHLLGVYMDHVVIERLKKDAETCDPQTFRMIEIVYSNWYTAKLIENSKTELMNFEGQLRRKGKLEAIDFIERLRRGAALNLRDQRGGVLYDLYEKSAN